MRSNWNSTFDIYYQWTNLNGVLDSKPIIVLRSANWNQIWLRLIKRSLWFDSLKIFDYKHRASQMWVNANLLHFYTNIYICTSYIHHSAAVVDGMNVQFRPLTVFLILLIFFCPFQHAPATKVHLRTFSLNFHDEHVFFVHGTRFPSLKPYHAKTNIAPEIKQRMQIRRNPSKITQRKWEFSVKLYHKCWKRRNLCNYYTNCMQFNQLLWLNNFTWCSQYTAIIYTSTKWQVTFMNDKHVTYFQGCSQYIDNGTLSQYQIR